MYASTRINAVGKINIINIGCIGHLKFTVLCRSVVQRKG